MPNRMRCAFHDRVLCGVGAQALVLGRVHLGIGERAHEQSAGLFELDVHLGQGHLLGRMHATFHLLLAGYFTAQVLHGEIVGGLGNAHVGRCQGEEHVRPA